jgi:hypothetical protein
MRGLTEPQLAFNLAMFMTLWAYPSGWVRPGFVNFD